MEQAAARIVTCPGCGGESLYGPANRWRPFCSAHCASVDFGAWASEQFRVAAESPPDDQPFGDARLQ